MSKRSRQRRKQRIIIFLTFFTCSLAASLLGAAIGTKYWFVSNNCDNTLDDNVMSCKCHFGLFSGESELALFGFASYEYKITCVDGDCIYSCGKTKAERQNHTESIMSKVIWQNMCKSVSSTDSSRAQSPKIGILSEKFPDHPFALSRTYGNDRDLEVTTKFNVILNDNIYPRSDNNSNVPEDLPLMNEGLWQATVACLCIGLVLAVVGAIFAIINTATTPVEAITGVPGLYLWNTLAALLDLICVICWAVQYHSALSENVLVENSADGWTTEGDHHLGYSFWLVVVAIIIHAANCVIIGVGTYEPKVKVAVENPHDKTGSNMLY